MRSRRRLIAAIAAATLMTGLIMGADPATAAPPTTFVEPIDRTSTDADFCGTDLSVEIVEEGEVRTQLTERRGEGYFSISQRMELTFTNTGTGATITARDTSRFKDLRVTDNGDGTLSVIHFGTGLFMVYDADGRIIGKDTGQSRFETVLGDNGTPDDYFDDTFISQEVILGSTGTNDDFCEVALDALT